MEHDMANANAVTGMDILLWRHAEAEDGAGDLARALNGRGRRQARIVAAWLRARQPKDLRILVSPATRALQTARALDLPFATDARLAPDAAAPALLAACDWPRAGGAALLVGHQPTLGRLAALLLTGEEADWSMRKGALWWLRIRPGEARAALRAVMPPEFAG